MNTPQHWTTLLDVDFGSDLLATVLAADVKNTTLKAKLDLTGH